MAFEKIPQDKIDRILELNEQGWAQQEIASELEISRATVSNYIAKTRGPVKRPELETSFLKVLALLEETLSLLKEQKEKKAVFCPICKGNLYPDMDRKDDVVLWGCPRCGYRGISPEPQWKEIEEFDIRRK